MGIYIPDMKMPKACVYRENGHFMICPLYDIDGYCGVLNKEAKHDLVTKLCDCPLVLVPPHGRLIDADVFLELCNAYAVTLSHDEFCKRLEYALTRAATVIPAEEGEE